MEIYWSGRVINLHGHACRIIAEYTLLHIIHTVVWKKIGHRKIKINPRKRFLRLGENFDSN